MTPLHQLVLLFFVAFFSASFFPSQAELLLFALLAIGQDDPLLLILAATAGNTLGSVGNYYIGCSLTHWQTKSWFPIKKKYIDKTRKLFQKHGAWTLLLAGIPFIGNPVTVAAGILKVNLWLFIPLVAAGKSIRYVLAWIIYAAIR